MSHECYVLREQSLLSQPMQAPATVPRALGPSPQLCRTDVAWPSTTGVQWREGGGVPPVPGGQRPAERAPSVFHTLLSLRVQPGAPGTRRRSRLGGIC